MKSVRFDFFATPQDLLPGLLAFEEDYAVTYFLQGLSDSQDIDWFDSAEDLPDFGLSLHGDRNHEPTYLALPHGTPLSLRSVPQENGSILYSVDLMTNATGFSLRHSGVYHDKAVIDGYIGTATENLDSIELCNTCIRKVRVGFTRIKSYFVGPDALRLMREGYRLTPSMQTPESFDLRSDEE